MMLNKDVINLIMYYKKLYEDYEIHKDRMRRLIAEMRSNLSLTYLIYGNSIVVIHRNNDMVQMFKICRICNNFIPWATQEEFSTTKQFCLATNRQLGRITHYYIQPPNWN